MPAEVVALIGVAVGGLLSWLASGLTERTRFRRDRQTYWRDQRVEAYVEFSAATKRYMSVLFRVGATMGVDAQTEPVSREDAAPLFSAAFADREVAFEKMLLVGSEPVCAAARTWVRAVYDLRNGLDLDDLTRDRWEVLVNAANTGRGRFHLAAKSDLGVQIGAPQ